MVLSTCTSATFASWATDVTKCTNPTFDKVLTSNWSNFKAQQDVLTVLRAITKVIQDRGGSESSTEYYASLLTALNTPSETKAAESFLLKLVFKSLPDSVLRSTFGEASKIIVHALNMCLSSGSDDVPQIKSLLVCLGHLLCAQSPDSWSIESVRHMYRHLLRFVDHEKPAIRKAIHVSVHNILNVNQVNLETSRFHPACHQTVEHLCSIVKQQSRQLIAVLCTQDNHCTRLLHCVELLTSILHLLPPKEVKTACECILELVEFPNSLVVAKSYDCFRVLFDNRPSFSLPLDLAARLLTALHSFRPNDPAVLDVSGGSSTSTGGFTGVDVMISWCKAIRSGCTYLCELSCESIESSVTHSRASDPSSADPQNVATEHMDKLLKCFLDILITTPLPNLKDTVAKMMDDLMVTQLISRHFVSPTIYIDSWNLLFVHCCCTFIYLPVCAFLFSPVYLEILQILVPHTRAEEISSFLTNLNDYFTSSSRTLQKRAYRLLELICLGSTPSSKEYLKEHLNQLLCWLHLLAGTVTRTSGFDAPLDVPSKEDLSGSSDAPDLSSHLAKLSFVGSNVATDHHLVKGNKRARTNVPWKPRIRCLHHLLIQLVTQEQEVISDPSTALENPRLREFANMFLPEILAAVCEANRVVRTLAYRLVVQLTLAFAGRAAEASSNIPASDVGSGIFRSTRNYKQVLPTGDETDDDNSSIGGSDGTSVGQPSSLGRFTCADGDDLRSTRSIASPMCLNICSALHLMLSRLWGCLPPQASVASNRGELVAQESAGRVMCHLLKHLRFRRSLLLVLESDDDEGAQTRVHASAILNNAHIISQLLIRSPQRPFARLGLQLVRLLLAFVGFSSISLTDLVQSLQSLHSTQKRPLRFAVKAILEKMVKRFGRKTLQGMMTPEYAKVVRNSARTMARLERRRTALPTANERANKALSAAGSVSLKESTSAVNSHRKNVRSISGRTHLSLPPRVHIPSFEELLVASSDEEIPITQRATSVRSAVSDKRSKKSVASALGPKSLAEELESLAETAGLCQRSRKRMLRDRGSVNDSDGSDDDGVEVDGRTFATIDTKRKGIRRGVRFADTTSMISDSVPKRKRSRAISEGSGTPGLWLVEQPDTDDIIDLSDPKALARHTAFTTDAKTARAAANALRKITAKQSVSTTFPIVDGKILIDGGERTTRGATQEIDWGELSSDDDGNNLKATGTWSDYRTPTKIKGKRSAVKSIPGRIYASSKAEGDMRRAGQPEPYAYVALGSGLGARGKTASTAERRRLLKAVGVGKHKRNKLKVGLGSAAKKSKPRHKKS
ncbi:unnamed protein product [Dicrocoelium dendriticum]|nr:unnamed protein product [Dicrocoelium dendriticum]